MQNIINFYHAVPTQAWVGLFGGSGAAVVVSILRKVLKAKATIAIHSITGAVSALLSFLPILLNHPETLKVFGAYATAIFTGANFVYAFSKVALPFLQDVYSRLKLSQPNAATSTAPITETPSYDG